MQTIHHWGPNGCTDEVGESDRRPGQRFASLTSTVVDKSIAERLGHEMYVKFLTRRARRSEVHFWHRERRVVVMEQCVVSASPMWRAMFEQLLGKVLQEDTVKSYMHVAARSLYITIKQDNQQTNKPTDQQTQRLRPWNRRTHHTTGCAATKQQAVSTWGQGG